MPIPAITYCFINILDSQSLACGRGRPNCFKVRDLFKKIYTSLYANFRRKKSQPIRPVEVHKLCLDFYVMSVLHKILSVLKVDKEPPRSSLDHFRQGDRLNFKILFRWDQTRWECKKKCLLCSRHSNRWVMA